MIRLFIRMPTKKRKRDDAEGLPTEEEMKRCVWILLEICKLPTCFFTFLWCVWGVVHRIERPCVGQVPMGSSHTRAIPWPFA